jgi:hypothetical protein
MKSDTARTGRVSGALAESQPAWQAIKVWVIRNKQELQTASQILQVVTERGGGER